MDDAELSTAEVHVANKQPNKYQASTETPLESDEVFQRKLWALFGVGFLFMPAWWAGLLEGWRRRKQYGSRLPLPWYLCLALSIAAAIILVVVLPVKLSGRQGPVELPPPTYYFTIQGDPSIINSLGLERDNSKLALFAAAVHQALQLPASYPVSDIKVWIEQAPSTSGRRHLMVPVATAKYVLGFKLLNMRAADLTQDVLSTKLAATNTTAGITEQLASSGFVSSQYHGQLVGGISTTLDNTHTSEVVIGLMPNCNDPPPTAALPANAQWDCEAATAHGDVCDAICNTGYTAAAGTSYQSTCIIGSFETITPASGDQELVCDPNPCPDPPDSEELPDNVEWNCGTVASGGSCDATCNMGYTAEANTSWTAACNLGSYSTPGPSAGDDELLCNPDPCPGAPTREGLPDGAAWECTATDSGESCSAQCNSGYTAAVSTSWTAACNLGNYSTPVPADGEATLQCNPNPCHGNPPWGAPYGAYFNCSTTPSGSACEAACQPRYTAEHGSWRSVCTAGRFGVPAPSQQDTQLWCSPNNCTGTPPMTNMPLNAEWTCTSTTTTASGSSCAASCQNGFLPRSGTTWNAVCFAGIFNTPAPLGGSSKLVCAAQCPWPPAAGQASPRLGAATSTMCVLSPPRTYPESAQCVVYCGGTGYIYVCQSSGTWWSPYQTGCPGP